MPEFQLDTSGVVDFGARTFILGNRRAHIVGWSDLDPFAQGYVAALFASIHAPYEPQGDNPFYLRHATRWQFVGFSDLAPETLARIMEDCAAWEGDRLPDAGRCFWEARQQGLNAPRFPPLTLTLSDAGKVVFA